MAQLKSTIVQGALTVTSNVVANKLIKLGGTSDQILMADGSTSNKSDLTALINAAVTIKGTLGTGGTITSLPTASASNLGDGYKVITAGTYNSVAAKIGDMFICYKNGSSYAWMHIPSGDDIEDTWRPVQVNGTQILANGNTTGAINLKAGTNVSITNSSGTVTFTATDTGATSITTTGSGNAVTSGSYDSATRKITLTKGNSFLPLSGGTLTGTLGFKSNYLIKPVADYRCTTSSLTGAITITLPAGIGNTMVSMWVDVYNYVDHKSFSVHVGGYTYSNSTWSNKPFAMVYGADHKVRLGHNGTSFVIYIGELNSSWAYPQISVRDVVLGYSPTYANWYNDWTISFTSDEFKNVTATLTDKAWTTRNLDPSQFSTTDTKVTQSNTTTANWRKVILSAQNDAAAETAVTEDTKQVYETPKVEVQPSTGSLRAAGTVQMNQLKITSTSMINHIEFARNSWNYIVASGGTSAAFGFVAGGKSASGANSTFAVLGDRVIPGQTDNTIDIGSSDYHFQDFYIKGKIYNGSLNYTLPASTGTLALTSDIPTIPTVNNGTLTIQKNGTTVATFTANQSGNATANITVPNPTDYYWANVKVSSSSSTATTPSVQKIGITGSTTATASAAVTMEYDSSYKALKFVFA